MADEKQFLDKDGLEHIIDTQIGKTDISGIGDGTIKGAIGTVKDSLDTVKGIVSNPNLLDNGWFTVNQRGQSEYTVNKNNIYTIDRWFFEFPGTVQVLDNGIKCIPTTAAYTHKMVQIISKDTIKKINGKKITISAYGIFKNAFISLIKKSDYPNSVSTATYKFTIPNTNDYSLFTNTFLFKSDSDEDYALCICWYSTASALEIASTKLELGSVSTLANDVAPDYQTELLKCQSSTADESDTYANKSLFPPISDAWLSTKAYAVGDYAIHNNLLWKCLVANTGTTPVEGANWTATSVSKELGSILKIKYFDSLISSQEGYVSSTPVDCQYILSVTNVNANASSNYMLATRVEKDDNNLPTVKYRQSNSGNTQYRFLYI